LETKVGTGASSSFLITTIDTVPVLPPTPANPTPTITVNEKKVPVFLIDAAKVTTAEFGIEAFATTGLESVIIAAVTETTTTNFVRTLPYIPEDDKKPIELDSVIITTGVVADTPVSFPIEITMTPKTTIAGSGTPLDPYVTVPSDPGLAKIYFNIPVYLFDNSPAAAGSAPVTWYFRGGLNNTLVDFGYANMSLGGAIIIGVGDILAGGAGSKEINIRW